LFANVLDPSILDDSDDDEEYFRGRDNIGLEDELEVLREQLEMERDRNHQLELQLTEIRWKNQKHLGDMTMDNISSMLGGSGGDAGGMYIII
jgi:hypothetical protein